MSDRTFIYCSLFVALLCGIVPVRSQQRKVLTASVTYVTPTVIYLNKGRQDDFALNDTVNIRRNGVTMGNAVITAVSKKSSAAQIIVQQVTFAVNDIAENEKEVMSGSVPDSILRDSTGKISEPPLKALIESVPVEQKRTENIVSGRIGLQYSGVLASDSRFDLHQPAATVRLDIQNLYGTGMQWSLYGRSYYDLSELYSRYGESSRYKNRVYEMQLRYENPASNIHYGLGRMTSAYVGGLGTFDGGFLYHRFDNITAGVLVGAKVQDRTLGVDGDDKKGAVFVNVRFGSDYRQQFDGTIAYGRELIESKLDREFLYLQNHLMLGPELSLYESSEIELNDIRNGKRERAFKLSNTYLSVNYAPFHWMTANVGYDGTRSVYLFETMKAIPDTMVDKNLLQGYRGGITFRLPYYMSLGGNISYRTRKGDARNARTVSATYRISDILRSDIGASVRYADIIGVYSDGTNITADIDRIFFNTLSMTVRYDYYAYRLLALNSSWTTQTVTVSAQYRISRFMYGAANLDKVYDTNKNSTRLYVEIGIRF